MLNLAVIPARGGSKRIPRKNIKDFFGKPVIVYSIELALRSGLFSEVMVSTDDQEIAEIAEKAGALVPFLRSQKNSDDMATTIDVIKEVLASYNSMQNKIFENLACIYPVAPLIQLRHFRDGFEILKKNNFDSVFPVMEYSSPVWRGFELDANGKARMLWPEHTQKRSQDLKKVYYDAGQWYWLKADKIAGSIFTDNSGTLVLHETEAQDIDNMSDWKMAELKYKILHEA